MAAAERRKDEGACIRRALVDVHPGHALVDFADFGHIAEVKVWVHAVAVHIHSQRDGVHVAGALAVAEEACPRCARAPASTAQLGVSDAAAAVVVGVE